MNLKSRILNHKGAALLLGAALLAGPVAFAGQGRGALGERQGFGGGRLLHRAMAALDLSDEQKERVHGIFQSSKPAMQALHEQMKTDRTALREAASATNPDRAAIGDAFLKVRADREAMKAQRQAIHEQVLAVLTPEQKARLEGFRAAHSGHRRGMRGGPDRD